MDARAELGPFKSTTAMTQGWSDVVLYGVLLCGCVCVGVGVCVCVCVCVCGWMVVGGCAYSGQMVNSVIGA